MIIFLVILLLNYVILVYMNMMNQKREILTIVKDKNSLKFLLTGDLYLEAEIKSDDNIDTLIVEILKNRAFELKDLVCRVELFNIENKGIDYLSIINNSN